MRRTPSFLFRKFKGIVPFLIVGYYFDRRNLVKARKWSDRFLQQQDAPYYAVGLATDALLMILEKRFAEAENQFAESLKRLPDIYDEHDEEYVRRFAELWLDVIASTKSRADFEKHGGQDGLLKAREDLFYAPASRWLKRRLRLPKPDRLDIWPEASSSIEQQISIEQPPPLALSIQLSF